MAKTNSPLLIAKIALQLGGDWGPLTTYTSRRGQIVVYPKSPPTSPPSPGQLLERQRFKDGSQAWWAMTPGQRTAWGQAAKKAHLQISGWNLFLWYQMFPQEIMAIRTIERQSGIDLL